MRTELCCDHYIYESLYYTYDLFLTENLMITTWDVCLKFKILNLWDKLSIDLLFADFWTINSRKDQLFPEFSVRSRKSTVFDRHLEVNQMMLAGEL